MQKSTEQRVTGSPDPSDKSATTLDTPALARRPHLPLPADSSQNAATEILSSSFSSSQRKRIEVVFGRQEPQNPDLAFSRYLKRTAIKRNSYRRGGIPRTSASREQNLLIDKRLAVLFNRIIGWLARLCKKMVDAFLGALSKAPAPITLIAGQTGKGTGPSIRRRLRFRKR